MLSVTVTIRGDKETQQKLMKLGPSLTNYSEAMRQIGTELKSFYSGQVFASQGGALGEKWASLSPKYKRRKAKEWPGRGPLVKTGEMQRSFTSDADHNSVTIGNTAPYFAYHQSSELPRTKLPRRTMLGVNSTVKTIIADIIDEDVHQKIERAGL